MLKPPVAKSGPDPLAHSKDIPEKQHPAALKPIVGTQLLCYHGRLKPIGRKLWPRRNRLLLGDSIVDGMGAEDPSPFLPTAYDSVPYANWHANHPRGPYWPDLATQPGTDHPSECDLRLPHRNTWNMVLLHMLDIYRYSDAHGV